MLVQIIMVKIQIIILSNSFIKCTVLNILHCRLKQNSSQTMNYFQAYTI